MTAYDRDLAYIHDAGFGHFAERAGPHVLKLFAEHEIRDGRVVDLGCGSGLWARQLIDAGFETHGIDISPAMISLARKRAPEARFVVGSFLEVEWPDCVAITSMGECLNYRFDERAGKASLRRLFRRAYRALEPGGLLVFDIAEPGRAGGSGRNFWEGGDWLCLSAWETDRRRARLTRRITTFRKRGKSYRRDDETHELQLYERRELAAMLRELGFRVKTLPGYGALELPAGWAVLVARKP